MTRFALLRCSQYVLTAFLVFAFTATAQTDYPTLAPFTAIYWPGGPSAPPLIAISGQEYEWLAIDGVDVAELVTFSQRAYGGKWDKRIAEDLVQVLSELGQPPGGTVELLVREPGNDDIQSLELAMTEANRKAVWEARYAEEVPTQTLSAEQTLTAEQARADLDALETALRERYSYFGLTEEATLAELEAVRARLDETIDVTDFAGELWRIMSTLRDGHAGIRSDEVSSDATSYAPFLVAWSGERAVAFEPDRADLLDPEHPYLVAIDDTPLEQWLDEIATSIPDGSAQMVRRRTAGGLRSIERLRAELGLLKSEDVQLTLESETGESTELTLPLSNTRPFYDDWPQKDSSLLPDNIGYLRLSSMYETAAPLVREWLGRFEDTNGLIVDVRGSGGGSARAQDITLPNSGLEVVLASMASFRPNGLLYDGRGVEVDVEVDPDPSYFLRSGNDNILKEALRYLESQ